MTREEPFRVRRRGAPIGDRHVNAIRKVVRSIEPLYDYGDKIVSRWPNDPDLNRELSKASVFLRALVERTPGTRREASGK